MIPKSTLLKLLVTLFLVVMTLDLILFKYANEFGHKKEKTKRLLKKASLKSLNSSISIHSTDNQDWEQLNEHVFFKRSAAFYFLDESLLRIFMVKSATSPISIKEDLKLKLTIIMKNNTKSFIYIEHLESLRHDSNNLYEFSSLNCKLNLKNIQKLMQNISLTISFRNVRTKRPINVKIKNFHQKNSKKKGLAICSKCYRFSSDNQDHAKVIYGQMLATQKKADRCIFDPLNFIPFSFIPR
jgi:hypothetical protein